MVDEQVSGFLLTPERFGLLMVALGSVPFLARWLWERLWKRADVADEIQKHAHEEAQRKRDEEVANLKKMMSDVSNTIQTGVAEIRGMIGKQDLAIQEVKLKQEWSDEARAKFETDITRRMDAFDAELRTVPKQIEESRHLLRNELTAPLLKAGKKE